MRRAKVYLVGAGTGNSELLTLNAVRILREADVVICDRLVSAKVRSQQPQFAALEGAAA